MKAVNETEQTEQETFNATAGRLRSFIERVERLTEESKALASDVKEVYAEAKSDGFDVPAMKKIVAIRSKDPADLAQLEAILETYKSSLNMD